MLVTLAFVALQTVTAQATPQTIAREPLALLGSPATVVAPRPLESGERIAVWTAATKSKDADVPKAGKFRYFLSEGRRVMIHESYLLEERYKLAERALKRLGDIWRPGEITSLENEPEVRAWLALHQPGRIYGKGPDGTPLVSKSADNVAVFRVASEAKITMTDGKRSVAIPTWRREDNPPGKWITPKNAPTASKPLAGMEGPPLSSTITHPGVSDPEERGERTRIAGEILAEWHRSQLRALRKAAPAFFRKADEDLQRSFADGAPTGREFGSLQKGTQDMLEDSMSTWTSILGFSDAASGQRWLQGARISGVSSQIVVTLPEYEPTGPGGGVVFPIRLP